MTKAEYIWIKTYVAIVSSRPATQRTWDEPNVEDIAIKAADKAVENFKARFQHSIPEAEQTRL